MCASSARSNAVDSIHDFFRAALHLRAELRNVSLSFQNQFWETMISYLNLGASALTLSTLTTRFVFPQFSLEGRRLWILDWPVWFA